MQRLLGIETEYGITIEGEENIDPVQQSIALIKSYRHDDFHPMWDYSGEDPLLDARGFRAKTLKEHPDEREQQVADRQRNLSAVEIKSDLILTNGARLYNDHAHPEYSTAECRSFFQLVAHDKGGERILQRCAVRRSQTLGQRVILYKNNTDFHGHSYGCHDNYLMRRDIAFGYLKESIMPFLITRQIFAGAGKVGIETESGMSSAGIFQLAQRSDFFSC
jgi:proteasome accessory factor A